MYARRCALKSKCLSSIFPPTHCHKHDLHSPDNQLSQTLTAFPYFLNTILVSFIALLALAFLAFAILALLALALLTVLAPRRALVSAFALAALAVWLGLVQVGEHARGTVSSANHFRQTTLCLGWWSTIRRIPLGAR